LSRSTDLNTFDVIFRHDGTNALLEETGNQFTLTSEGFTIIDNTSPSPKAFYRFQAELTDRLAN